MPGVSGKSIWIGSSFDESCPLQEPLPPLDSQQCSGGATLGGVRDDSRAFQSEVSFPRLQSRMKQRDDFTTVGIYRGDVWPFEPIAVEACQREVFQRRRASVLRGN